MKFLHTSDWHIGSGARRIPNYLDRHSNSIDQIYSIARQKGIKVIVVAGDIFQKNEPTSEERDLLLKKLLQYDDKFTTIIMEGNHDSIDFQRSSIHFLKILESRNKFKNLRVSEVRPDIINIDDNYFITLPSFRLKILKKMLKSVPKDRKSVIVVGHDTTIGTRSDTGYRLKSGIDLNKFKKFDVTYYAMGGIHLKQQLSLPNAFQCGSPIQHKFDEYPPKGVLIVDTDNPTEPEFIEVKSKPLVVVKEGGKIPKDAYVKLLLKKSSLKGKFPENVIATGSMNEAKLGKYKVKESITSGLKPFLKSLGLNREEIKGCFKILKKVRKKAGV